MNKLILASLVTVAVGSIAQAGSWSADLRADYQSTTLNDAAKATSSNLRNNSRFNLQTARLDGKGNFTDAVTYRVRFRLNKDAAATNKRDSLTNWTDFAYIQHKINDMFALQMGKLTTDIGGYEGMTSGPDLYFTSSAWSDEDVLRYAAGVKGIINVADQEIDLNVVNPSVDADANGATTGGYDQNRQSYGVVYKGNFMNKTLLPYLGYFEDSIPATDTTGVGAATDRKNNFAIVGLKYDMNPFFVEADYHMNTYKGKSVVNETDKTNTLVVHAGYKFMDNMVAKAKYESSEEEVFTAASTSGKNKYQGYQLALEMMPTNDKNFRYHVAYTSRDKKPETGDTQTTQNIYVGTRIFADFLK